MIRHIQCWSFTSILDEFRLLCGRRIFDIEQFIEHYDIDLIDIPISDNIPHYIQIYTILKVINCGL
jgi:hypothetical protein